MIKHNNDLAEKVDSIKRTNEVIAQSLKEMIYEGSLKPGDPLKQDEIAQMFGVSRVPVRDALNMLISMGLAVNLPRRGVVVHPLSKRLVEELFHVRKVLESEAVSMAAANMTTDTINLLNDLIENQVRAQKSGDIKRFEELDERFHTTLLDTAGNRTLAELVYSLWLRIKQARWSARIVSEHATRWMENSIRRHRDVVVALESGHTEEARSVIMKNIEGSLQEVIENLEQMGWLDSDQPA